MKVTLNRMPACTDSRLRQTSGVSFGCRSKDESKGILYITKDWNNKPKGLSCNIHENLQLSKGFKDSLIATGM